MNDKKPFCGIMKQEKNREVKNTRKRDMEKTSNLFHCGFTKTLNSALSHLFSQIMKVDEGK